MKLPMGLPMPMHAIRYALVLPAFVFLTALVAGGQQAGPSTQSPSAQVIPAPQQPAPASVDPKTVARSQKEKEKAEAKARKEEEKSRKEAEKDATFLKLQNNQIVAATFDEDGNPIKLPPCSRKDKECQAKRKEFLKQKRAAFRVENGTLTVDGWTGKARLNYDVKNFQYLYVSVPGYGTLVASPERFPNATELPNALNGKTLTMATGDGHTIEVASDENISGKQKRPIFFTIDHDFVRPGSFPTVGYGFVSKAPYAWPGILPPSDKQKQVVAKAPPLPKDMEMKEMAVACQTVLPGETPRPVKVNGVLVVPPICKANPGAATSGAFSSGVRPPDGSGAASTGVDDIPPKH